jgi:hypothetical protein
MGSITKKFTLDDDSVWTTRDLSALIGISHSSAYYRLNKSTDPAQVLKPRDKIKVTNGLKLYTLDDGTEWTSAEVSEHTGCKKSTASTRLTMYTDPKKVLAPPYTPSTKIKPVTDAIKRRMLYDPEGHWKLINRST